MLVCRVDERPVQTWHIANLIDPAAAPRAVRYPRAGTDNAIVTLHVVGVDGARVEVVWDREAFEYLAAVSWTPEGPPLALVQSRDQRTVHVLAIDPDSGETELVWKDGDETWTHITPGVPAWLPGGRLLTAGHRDDTRRLLIDGEPATPVGLQVDSVIDVSDDVVFRATEEPTEMHVWRLSADGSLAQLSDGAGVHGAAVGGDLTVLVSETDREPFPVVTASRDGEAVHTFGRFAELPLIEARPTYASGGPEGPAHRAVHAGRPRAGGATPGAARSLRGSALRQGRADAADAPGVPVVRRPGVRRAGGRRSRHPVSRGGLGSGGAPELPGRGARGPGGGVARRRRAVPVPGSRAGSRCADGPSADTWCSGRCCAAATCSTPGSPGRRCPTRRYYDTHYTERYLGMPEEQPEAYRRTNVVKDAAGLRR